MDTRLTKIADLTNTICGLTRITTRAYHGGDAFAFCARTDYPEWLADPFTQHMDELVNQNQPITCITTQSGFHYGIIESPPYRLILGPVLDPHAPDNARDLAAAQITDDPARREDLIELLTTCPKMTISGLLPLLLNTNNLLHFDEEENTASDDPLEQRILIFTSTPVTFYDFQTPKGTIYHQTTDDFFADLLRRGDIDAMREWLLNPAFINSQLPLCEDNLRNTKDNFIVMLSFVALAAAQAGLPHAQALGFLAHAVRTMETMNEEDEILRLLIDCASQFTEKVHEYLAAGQHGSLVDAAESYIRDNLHSVIRTSDIADALYVSRSHLSQIFREQTGQTLSDYIQQSKIKEACHLLQQKNMTILQISNLLGFSSQSYFTKVFKLYTGLTPKEYRESL